jgi:hypothetical protein
LKRECFSGTDLSLKHEEEKMYNNKKKTLMSIFLLVILLTPLSSPLTSAAARHSADSLKPRWVPQKPTLTVIGEGESHEIFEVKFKEGTMIRLREGGLTTLSQDDLSGLERVLSEYPIREITRLFSQPEQEIATEKAQLEAETGEQLADLNLYFRFYVDQDTNPELVIDALNALPIVEIAYPAPLPAPQLSDIGMGHQLDGILGLLATPNFTSKQGYLNQAPGGINAKFAWGIPGGKGDKVRIIDIEYNYNKNHEDLTKTLTAHIGGTLHPFNGDNHGTAVLGELVADKNSFGVTGISYRSEIRFISPCFGDDCASYNPADAVNIAKTNTSKGDVILLEQQTTVCNLARRKYGPVEWYQSTFDAIKNATAAGRNVVEAAGNGAVNLDSTVCDNKFNRRVRDSGAIIVGAGAPPSGNYGPDRSRLRFSSFGSRVDLQGWGKEVVTTGYGYLYKGSNKNQWYTQRFGGTSSASPIVTGAVALFSSIAQTRGNYLNPKQIREILVKTGSPQQDAPGRPKTQHIGPRPNLRRAIKKLISMKIVFVDGSHNNYYKIGSGYQGWVKLLRNNNYTVKQLNSSVTASKLKGVHVFVALMPRNNYTSHEITVLKSWVKTGGSLLIIGDWGVNTEWSQATRALSAKFRIFFNKTRRKCARDPSNYEIPHNDWIYLFRRNYSTYKKIMSGLNRTETFCTTTLYSSIGKRVIFLDEDAVPSGKPIVMGREFGKGRVLVLADSNFWSDPSGQAIGLKAFDNRKFALRAMSWLATGNASGLEFEFYLGGLTEETIPELEGPSPLGP